MPISADTKRSRAALAALDAGALDVLNHGADGFEVRTEPADVHKVAGNPR